MIDSATQRLQYLCDTIPPLLADIGEETFSFKPDAGKWSKKEIIGHLIDSAANNHQRFIRVQFEDKPAIKYDQDKWNVLSFHQQIEGQQIIDFWTAYNKQLIEIIKRIPEAHLQRECKVGDQLFTLSFLINDYVEHMEHHLHEVIDY